MPPPAPPDNPGWSFSGAGPAGSTPEADAQLYLHPQTLSRLSSLELRAKLIVEGVMSGAHKSPYRGYSVEFEQHRPYVPGDDLRHLDWKVFARTDKLHLKQYQQETNLDLLVLVDSSGSMSYGSRSFQDASGLASPIGPHGLEHWTKFDHATATAAALSYVALRQGDRVGVSVFADDLRASVKRTSSMSAWRQIVGVLSTHPIDRPTNIQRVTDQILGKLTNRCLLVILSDFFEDPASIRSALARIRHRGHDAILVQVLDQRETQFDLRGELPLLGLEGEPLVKIDARAIRDEYLRLFREHGAAVEAAARGLAFDFLQLSTHDWLGPPISAFLARRASRLRRSKQR